MRSRHPRRGPRAAPVGRGGRRRSADLSHSERAAGRLLRGRSDRARLPGRSTRRPFRSPSASAGNGPNAAVRFTGRTSFFLFVVLPTAEDVAAYVPDLAAIAATGANALLLTAPGADSPGADSSGATESSASTASDAGQGADYVLRVFGPNVGIDEDPATGSAQCAAGPWWSEALGRPGDVLVARQLSARGAVFRVHPTGERVRISGHATTVLTGHLC